MTFNNRLTMPPTTKKTKQRQRPSAQDRESKPQFATETDIASRAYQLFIERGGEHGRDVDDWLVAQRELLSPDR